MPTMVMTRMGLSLPEGMNRSRSDHVYSGLFAILKDRQVNRHRDLYLHHPQADEYGPIDSLHRRRCEDTQPANQSWRLSMDRI
jgi:hypothetical protein